MTALQIAGVIAVVWIIALALFVWAWARFNAPYRTPEDPELDALRAEHAKPLRERRHLRVIEAQMQSIINARLAGGR